MRSYNIQTIIHEAYKRFKNQIKNNLKIGVRLCHPQHCGAQISALQQSFSASLLVLSVVSLRFYFAFIILRQTKGVVLKLSALRDVTFRLLFSSYSCKAAALLAKATVLHKAP